MTYTYAEFARLCISVGVYPSYKAYESYLLDGVVWSLWVKRHGGRCYRPWRGN